MKTSARFTVPLLAALLGALWLIAHLVTTTSPRAWVNVAIVMALLFIAVSSLVALLSWLLMRYLRGEDQQLMALRHGAWGGLFVLLLTVLNWGSLLSPLMVAALLLALISAEAVIMLRGEPSGAKAPAARRPAKRR